MQISRTRSPIPTEYPVAPAGDVADPSLRHSEWAPHCHPRSSSGEQSDVVAGGGYTDR